MGFQSLLVTVRVDDLITRDTADSRLMRRRSGEAALWAQVTGRMAMEKRAVMPRVEEGSYAKQSSKTKSKQEAPWSNSKPLWHVLQLTLAYYLACNYRADLDDVDVDDLIRAIAKTKESRVEAPVSGPLRLHSE